MSPEPASETRPGASVITEQQAQQLAHDWIEAWNDHDIDRLMRHYADDVEFTSPFIISLLNEASGRLRGQANLAAYFRQGLAAYPTLHFELIQILRGVDSVTVYYRSVRDLYAAEVMVLDASSQVVRVSCHYRDAE